MKSSGLESAKRALLVEVLLKSGLVLEKFRTSSQLSSFTLLLWFRRVLAIEFRTEFFRIPVLWLCFWLKMLMSRFSVFVHSEWSLECIFPLVLAILEVDLDLFLFLFNLLWLYAGFSSTKGLNGLTALLLLDLLDFLDFLEMDLDFPFILFDLVLGFRVLADFDLRFFLDFDLDFLNLSFLNWVEFRDSEVNLELLKDLLLDWVFLDSLLDLFLSLTDFERLFLLML